MNSTKTWNVLSASTITGNDVVNPNDEKLGKIEDLMIDPDKGCITYAVVSFGGSMETGDKLFAIPWSTLTLDSVEQRFVLDVRKELLEKAPAFDKSDWPNMADRDWVGKIHGYYGAKPIWEQEYRPDNGPINDNTGAHD